MDENPYFAEIHKLLLFPRWDELFIKIVFSSTLLGTGDLDCIYHFALNELKNAIAGIGDESQLEMLKMLVDGRRLRDISDLPFDLAV